MHPLAPDSLATSDPAPVRIGCEHVFDVRRAPLPLGLLVPGRRFAAGRARPDSAGARLRGARVDRPQLGLGFDGVRRVRSRARAAADPRRRGGSGRRAPSDAARGGRPRLVEPLQRPDQSPRSHAREARPTLAGVRRPRGRARSLRRPGLSERMRAARRARRVHAPAVARCVRSRADAGRAPAPVSARRQGSQSAAGGARSAARIAVRRDRQRARSRSPARTATGRVRRHTAALDAGRLRAGAARQLQSCAGVAGGDGGALSGAP